MLLHHIGLCVVFCISSSRIAALPFYSLLEGSTDEDELSNFNFSLPISNVSPQYQTTTVDSDHEDADFVDKLVNFLEENMLLILVGATLLLLVFLIVCGSIFMSHRRKVNAYYPSSFPSKMYVDNRDKTGGAKPFNEVQDKVSPEQESEPVDSHMQLQADIMRAARSLRTANKSVDAAERNDPRPEDSSYPVGTILDQQLPSVPEEKELCELPDSEAAAEPSGPPHGDDSAEPASLRPSSLHIHSDAATLQLIAGEKTAF
ncbi:transmembrane protein 119b [Brachyistius frenatus]|uniref:transmembrane protein 119b n=1 Tax=Brachyistius frenatus TaxID=100188 RepID=UPI0037E7C800